MDVLPLFTSDNWQEQIGVHKVGLMLTEPEFCNIRPLFFIRR